MLIDVEVGVKDQNTSNHQPISGFHNGSDTWKKKICVTLITEMERNPNKEKSVF